MLSYPFLPLNFVVVPTIFFFKIRVCRLPINRLTLEHFTSSKWDRCAQLLGLFIVTYLTITVAPLVFMTLSKLSLSPFIALFSLYLLYSTLVSYRLYAVFYYPFLLHIRILNPIPISIK
jgi:hypothetical protein